MRWTKIVALFVLLFLMFLLYLFLAPFIYKHTEPPLWLHTVRGFFIPGGNIADALATGQVSFARSTTSFIQQPYTWAILISMGILFVLVSINEKLRGSTHTYGSARYATRGGARAYQLPRVMRSFWRLPLMIVRVPLALVLTTAQRAEYHFSHESLFRVGTYKHCLIVLSEKQQQDHILITAPTGSGKSSLLIIPNLLTEQGNRSLFIADLKNELYRITAGAIARHHQIWWFNPARPDISHSYNPLAYVKDAIDADLLADCWVSNTGDKGDESYWTNSAKLLISAIVLHLRATEPHAAFSRVSDLMMETTFDDLKNLLGSSPSREARRKAKAFLNYLKMNERLVGSVMTEITNRFQLFDSEAARKVTTVNEIDFQAMVDDPTALYLSIPRSEIEQYRPLMACFTMQMFRTWEQCAAQTPDGSLPRSIACYMDEFANIGYIPNYHNFVSTARYLRVALLMVIQNFSQLDHRYGNEAAETIRENANTQFLLPGAGLRECKHYSEVIGETTVPTWTRSVKGTQVFWNDQETWTQSETRRRLLTPDEIRTMKPRSILMIPSSQNAMIVHATPYYESRALAPLANIPYNVTHVHTGHQPDAVQNYKDENKHMQQPAQVVDAEQRKSQDELHFSED